ncbi:hypothetical protein LPB73_07605 [Tardiphaga sp. 37S4]|uniref:hypothetical protein n=1 Tax=Tardiphaga sp. 37S4 TaxID=1404741 RepID=UPI001E515544|nr:hypothetical protein [Tardiphaga sp. 37S4]UFS77233.1 hypothetical protein LPB73_07605 [Tardiphaga sp. 37S4]
MALLALLLLTGCGRNDDEVLKQIAAATKANAETSKQILDALKSLQTSPELLASVKAIETNTSKIAASIEKIQPSPAAAKAPFAFPAVIEPAGNGPAECAKLGYAEALPYSNDPRWFVCK